MPIRSECPRPVPELTGAARELFDALGLPWNTPADAIERAAVSARFAGAAADDHAALVRQVPDGPLRRIMERHSPWGPVSREVRNPRLRCDGCAYDRDYDGPPQWPCDDYRDAAEAAGLPVEG